MSVHRSSDKAEYDARYGSEDEKYTGETSGYTPSFLTFMRKWVSRSESSPVRALEVGCGDGYFSGQLSQLGCRVDAIDLSAVGVAKAKARFPEVNFQVHDLSQPVPFADSQFDIVWCSEVLEHLFSPLFVLHEIRRVLRPAGRLLCTVPYHGRLKNVGIALFAFERHYDPTYPHLRFYTKKSLSSLAQAAGLEVEEIGSCGSQLGLRDWLVATNILFVARKPT